MISYHGGRLMLLLAVVAVFLSVAFFGWTLVVGELFSDDFAFVSQGRQGFTSVREVLSSRTGSFYSPVNNLLWSFFAPAFGYHASLYFVYGLYDIAGLVANQIIFLEPGAPRTLREGEALLWWDVAGRSYRVRGATSRKP